MLTKLLKKDFQATTRCFIPLIVGFVFLTILCKILLEICLISNFKYNSSALILIPSIFFGLYVIYLIALYVMTYVFIISDFYKTVVGEQAYLTHTLPVKTSTIILSKLSITVFWQLVTSLLTALSFCLFFAGHFSEIAAQITASDLAEFEMALGMSVEMYFVYVIIALVIGFFSTPLMFYASIAIGHLFGKHRIVGAIGAYLGIYTIMQIICAAGLLILGFSFYNDGSLSNIFSTIMSFSIVYSVITSIAYYIITEVIFRKKLNLE